MPIFSTVAATARWSLFRDVVLNRVFGLLATVIALGDLDMGHFVIDRMSCGLRLQTSPRRIPLSTMT